MGGRGFISAQYGPENISGKHEEFRLENLGISGKIIFNERWKPYIGIIA